jgi:hypothetical protein
MLKKINEDWRIVVLPRGHVLVGAFDQEGDGCTLKEASVIRRWGTKKGLGELAQEGPKADTTLDPANGIVRFNANAVIMTIDTDIKLWQK